MGKSSPTTAVRKPEALSERDLAAIERTTQEVGRYLLEHSVGQRPSLLERRWWDDRIMTWAMQDESVKVQMFRFIDVLPMLDTSAAVVEHLREYFEEVSDRLPSAVRLGLAVAKPHSIAGRAMALAARRNAMSNARRFIAGTSSAEVLAAAMRERKLRRAFTLDILGEAVASEAEADQYLEQYLHLLGTMSPVVNAWPEVSQIDRDQFSELPRVNVSVKLSALDSQFDPIDPEGTTTRVATRLRKLLRTARQHRAHVHIDMESYRTKTLTLEIFKRVLSEEEFRDWTDVGIVLQAYLRECERDLDDLAKWARERGTPVWVRLVKGAYWDHESVFAAAQGWPVPVFQEKWQSDANFEQLSRFLMCHWRTLRPALASHNLRSLAHGIATARQLGVPLSAYELQMLYGMADNEKQALVNLGHRLRIYMPYGELIPGMAYLVRRLLENTSNESFLRASFAEHLSPEQLLMNPIESARHTSRPHPAARAAKPLPTFQNEPHSDFSLAPQREAMQQAIELVRSQLGKHWPLITGGQPADTMQKLTSLNPSRFAEVVGTTANAGHEDADRAVAAAKAAQPKWQALGVERRAELLKAAAAEMRARRFELAAWEVFECGKPWRESDADVAEAIDFCEYYALGAVRLQSHDGIDVPGEENDLDYLPRGVCAVIAPWNFPLAILTGMATAALVTGNTVVLKPAEQSPIVAAMLMEVLQAVGFPPGVVNYLPGTGETAGARLVEHPDVAIVAFTGSRPVGLAINRRAAEVSGEQSPFVKRVIAEMGGKNAIIIDADADLDEAVLGVVKSAFGYQGQKCSACSRTIVLSSVYDAFVGRLIEATRSLKLGPADDPATSVGPVIDKEAFDRIRKYIDIGSKEAKLALGVDAGKLAEQGYFIGPHIFTDVLPTARIAQEEIFGPVLAVLRVATLDDAFAVANGTQYALTGGIFSRSPANLARARRELMAGNLYLNRPITGAMVGRQPFGGFKMSGIGSQAGGPDYLLQFVLPRTVTENTMRRGFVPPAEAAQGSEGE